jgi:MFS family permease
MSLTDLSALRRRYVLITVFTWLPVGIGMAVMMLLMAARGLDLATIGLTVVLYGLTVTVLELPTGGLADLIGRRGVLVVSAAVNLTATGWLLVAATGWEFIAITVLRGVARALSSGPAEAWYVDAVHAVDSGGDIRRGLAAGQTANSISLGAGTLGGGALPLILPLPDTGPVTALSAPMLLSALLYGALLLLALFGMPEARPHGGRPGTLSLFAALPRTIAAGIRLSVGNSRLSRLLLTFLTIGAALTAVEMLTPGRLSSLLGDPNAAATAYGVITAIGFAASGLGSAASHGLTRLLRGEPRAVAVTGTVVSATGLIGLFVTGGLSGPVGAVTTAAGYALMFFGGGLRGPVQSELIHREVTAGERATVISIESLIMQGGGALAAVGLPVLATTWSVPGAWLVAGLALAASAVLFRRGKAVGVSPVGGRPEPVEVVSA